MELESELIILRSSVHGVGRNLTEGDADVDSTDKGWVGVDCAGTVTGACRILDLDFGEKGSGAFYQEPFSILSSPALGSTKRLLTPFVSHSLPQVISQPRLHSCAHHATIDELQNLSICDARNVATGSIEPRVIM